MKLLKNIFQYFLIAVFLSACILIIMGGGFGERKKENDLVISSEPPLLFAHRGMINYFPENSMEGIAGAKSVGFNAIEIDIRKSKDGEYILFHDDSASRLLGINKLVEQLTLQELKQSNILFNGKKTTSKVVSLNEVLENHKNDFIIYLDMKIASKEDADIIARIIDQYDIYNSTIVADANFIFIGYLEYFYPRINTAIEGFTPEKEWTYKFLPKKFKPDYISGFAGMIDSAHVSWLRKNNLLDKRIIYGVNSENIDRIINLEIKKVIVDYDSSMTILMR